MKERYVIACADLHGRLSRPIYRTDDYLQTFLKKVTFIVETANKYRARIMIAGDIFDSSKVQPEVVNALLPILQAAYCTPYVVEGQHDLLHHTDLYKTPLYTLVLAKAVRLIQGQYDVVTGAGFEREIPKGGNEFLLTHFTITEDTPPFFLEDALSAKEFISKYPGYRYIISGDYHPSHYTHDSYTSTQLINCGTLMRNKKDMIHHNPRIWLIDRETKKVKAIDVPHEPFEEVFDVKAIQRSVEHDVFMDTTRLKELMHEGTETLKLGPVVWKVYEAFKRDGVKVPRVSVVKEVLQQCQNR